ncbi:MAG: prepilin-type N-terminal cleavage/methylation domain-containing protein [Desulfobacteraceae bacterium]|nr:MAG: prepilin-type N-terminal cleavage/methylation domain-containing protein [Desulfobacteraceae bacterium]
MLQKLRLNHNQKGFTLIELMIVIAIIGILAAIAIPNFISYRKRGYYSAANADIKNAYTAAQAYFSDYPTGEVTSTVLAAYGFKSSPSMSISISGLGQTDLDMYTVNGAADDRTYHVDSEGSISFQ